ncbi:hypothetical protein Tco_0550232, partial [Tanacetum coccineum]
KEIGNPYSRRFDEYNKVFNNETEHLSNEYILRIGKKGYVLDDVWEKWHSFVCITDREDDALPLGRVNGARFKAMIRKELEDSLILINRGLIQAISTSLPPQPIGEATKASNLQSLFLAVLVKNLPDYQYSFESTIVERLFLLVSEPKFLIKMPLRRNMNINDVYEQEFKQHIMVKMKERSDQFVDQLADRMNDMINPGRRRDHNGRRSEGEESENPFFQGDHHNNPLLTKKTESEPIIWDIGDEKEEYPFVDNYLNFQEDENNVPFSGVVLGVEEESMPVYDTDIEDVIEEEEGFVRKGGFGGEEDNIEDIVVVANDLCSLMIQTILSIYFEEYINTKSHELMSFGKSIIIKGINLDDTSTRDE